MIHKNFRIGNYFTPTDGRNSEFAIATLDDFSAWALGARYGKEIPLSDELLLRCGFEKGSGCVQMTIDNGMIFYENGVIELCLGEYANGFDCPHIDKLHLLQNLFFDVTGKELPVPGV